MTQLASLLSIQSLMQPSQQSPLEHPLQPSNDLNDTILIDRRSIKNEAIESYVIALGSNYDAVLHLAIARDQILKHAASCHWSSELINPDYTASRDNQKPNYTNQCGLVKLKTPLSFKALTLNSKNIEHYCKRDVKPLEYGLTTLDTSTHKGFGNSSGQVSIDLDIIAVRLAGQWRIIKQRYPLKAHEMIGICELIDKAEQS